MITKLEIRRQTMHVTLGLLAVTSFYFNLINEFYWFLLLCFAIFIFSLTKHNKVPIFSFLIKHFERKQDKKDLPGKGTIYGIIGILLAIVLFERNIALASIMILTLGDAIGPVVGHFGRIKHPLNNKRFIEGLIAGIIVGTLGSMIFVVWYKALIASTIAMIAESIDEVRGMPINDNIVVPVVAGIVLVLLG